MVGVIIMKKILICFIIGVVFILTACKKDDEEANFIPTMPPDYPEEEMDFPGEDSEDVPGEPTDAHDDTEEPADDEDIDPDSVETTTKYVKLRTFGSILNVRSTPAIEEGNIVGFLVHTEPVEVISIEDNWAKILYHGEVRYVSADYLSDTVPPYISPPTPTPTTEPAQ